MPLAPLSEKLAYLARITHADIFNAPTEGVIAQGRLFLCALSASVVSVLARADSPALADFHKQVEPILSQYCSDCHADGAEKGNVAFDQSPSDDALIADTELWWKVLKNVRAGLMPPPSGRRPHGGGARPVRVPGRRPDWERRAGDARPDRARG